MPSTLSTVLPLTVRAWDFSQLAPTAVAEVTRLGGDALDDDVVAEPAVEDVDAGPAEEHVVARAAEEGVVAVTAEEHVVAVAAVSREQRRVGGEAGGVDHVVAGQGVDRQPVAGRRSRRTP